MTLSGKPMPPNVILCLSLAVVALGWATALSADMSREELLEPMTFNLFEPVDREDPVLQARAELARLPEEPAGDAGTRPQWHMSLNEFLAQVLENNLDIRIASYQPALSDLTIESNRAAFDFVLGSGFSHASSEQPQASQLDGGEVVTSDRTTWDLSASQRGIYGYSLQVAWNNSRTSSDNIFTTFNPSFTSNLSFRFTQPILKDFGRFVNKRQIEIARNNFEKSEEEFRRQVIDKVKDAEGAYWGLLYQIDNLKVQEEGLKLAKDHYEINKTRVEVGTMAPLDIAQAEAGVASAEESVINARSSLRGAEDVLRSLLNLPIDSPLWTAEILPTDRVHFDDRAPDLNKALENALEHRIELKKAEIDMLNREIDVKYSKNQKLPDLSVTAGYSAAGVGGTSLIREGAGGEIIATIPGGYTDALEQVFGIDYPTWSVGAEVSYPLFNRAARTSYQSAIINRRLQADTIENLKLGITQEVRDAVRRVETDRERVRAARVSVRLSEKQLDAEQKKYEHGLSTSFQVLEFQKDLTAARSRELLAITDYQAAWLTLERAMGTLLETKSIKISDAKPDFLEKRPPLKEREIEKKEDKVSEPAAEKPRKSRQLKKVDEDPRRDIFDE